MSVFNECHQKWYFQYIEKIETPIPYAFKFGSKVHNALEKTLKQKIANEDEVAVKQLVLAGTKRLVDIFGEGWEKLIDPSWVEMRLQNRWFTSIIDLLVKSRDGKYYLLDWKTTSFEYDNHRIISDQQLTSYAWMMHNVMGIKADYVGFITLNKKNLMSKAYITTRSDKQVTEMRDKILTCSDEVQKQPHDKNPSACDGTYGKCPFYDKCWGHVKPMKVYQNELPRLS